MTHVHSILLRLLGGMLCLAMFPTNASADVTFNFIYGSSPEFNHPTLGPMRRAALEDAGQQLGSLFTHTAIIDISISSSNDNTDTLASAGSAYPSLPVTASGGYYRTVVQEKIITGTDLNGATPDGGIDINFGQPWDFDDDIDPNRWDFKSTIIHELQHALGFGSGILNSGEDGWNSGIGRPGLWEIFDDFLSDGSGTPLVNDTTFVLDRPLWLSVRSGGLNGLFFNGPNAIAANGGNPVGLYSPSTFEEGSSHSHLDDENPALQSLMMASAALPGPSARTLSGIERGILTDIGYSLKAAASSGVAFTACAPSSTGFQVTLAGPANRLVSIERLSNLGSESWTAVQTVALGSGTVSYTFPASGSMQSYRGLLLPAARPAGAGGTTKKR